MLKIDGKTVSPWDLMQSFDADRFGPDIFDKKEQARWARAIFIGGLPYMWRMARPVLEQIYRLSEAGPGDKVLLFGESLESCGFISDLEALVGTQGKVTPIDIQEDARNVTGAKQRGKHGMIGTFSYAGYTRHIGDAEYDIVLNLQGIQHAEDWTEAGAEFLRIMKPGRRLVMSEIVLGAPEQLAKIASDLHLQHLIDKIFSARGMEFADHAYYSRADLTKAFDGLMRDIDHFEWRGLEVFWGRKT